MWILLAIGCVETAVNAIEYTDTWIQGERARGVDVLWVQDTSATMSEEQELLEEAATHFVAGLTFAVIDFRLGMVSTDVEADPPGTLLGPVLTDETPEMEEAFISLLTNAKEGSRNEQGIEAAMAAAHPSLTPDFARTDADLEIIFFSDEDDHGDVELTAILDALQEPRVDTELQVTAIVGDAPEGCASLAAAADPGFRYLSLQEATGGLRESPTTPGCSTGWA